MCRQWLANLTSRSEEELVAEFERLKIAPPVRRLPKVTTRSNRKTPERHVDYDWDEWLESTVAAMAEWQRFAIVKLLDKVRLLEVVETELEI